MHRFFKKFKKEIANIIIESFSGTDQDSDQLQHVVPGAFIL